MSGISYADASVPVREDLRAAHERQWQRLAQPGTWWTGRERVAIAAEVREAARCPLCRERKAPLSPQAVEGKHVSSGELPEAAVDVIHRVVTDPGRLTRAWFDNTLASGLTDAQYVELIGVVVTVVSIDSFCRGLGVPVHPLPEPAPGDPSRRRPPAAQPEGAWVPMIPNGAAKGAEADLYESRRTFNVARAMSLVPDEVRGLKDLGGVHYLPFAQINDLRAGRSLSRAQLELIAGRVSALRECYY
jgi:alkylhydroperoxidase family enzyme